MNFQIIKIDFKKDENNQTILTDSENIDKIVRWVLPIIEKNGGWGTKDLTQKSFLVNPQKYQIEIDGTVWNNVNVFIQDGSPVALLEFSKHHISDTSIERHKILKNTLDSKNFSEISNLLEKKFPVKAINEINDFLDHKPIYTDLGLVLRPNLQGKKTGISEELYKIIKDGIAFGWTSNPVIVRQWRKSFRNVLFFPTYGEFPKNISEWAICLYVYSDWKTYEKNKTASLEFGAIRSQYFVENRGEEYVKLTSEMAKTGKITFLDEKRLRYVLSQKSCASAIVSWN